MSQFLDLLCGWMLLVALCHYDWKNVNLVHLIPILQMKTIEVSEVKQLVNG